MKKLFQKIYYILCVKFRRRRTVCFPVIYGSKSGPIAYVEMDKKKAKRLLEADI